MTPWETLLARIRRARTWPLPEEKKIRDRIGVWSALRESDEPKIRGLMKWPADRPLIIDNLPEKVVTAYGDLLFGEDPDVTAADPGDQERAENMTEAWPSDLGPAEETCASEGEVWWRGSTNPALPHPIVTWHSRADVIPQLHGRNVLACAFVDRLHHLGGETGQTVWRHIELHGTGVVLNLLFRGRDQALGQEVPLDRHPDTRGLVDRWDHGLPVMLAGRIVNRWGRRPNVGISIYNGIWPWFLTLNETASVGRENMRLTGKKRAVVPASSLRVPDADDAGLIDRGDGVMVPGRPVPQFDAGEDVLVDDPLDVDEGGNRTPPFKILEYSFEADQYIAYYKFAVELVCQRCDLVPQFTGTGDFGSADSGTALRVRLLPTTNAAEGRGRPWDDELPRIALACQLLETLPAVEGGIGREEWTKPGEPPSIQRSTPLPEDENEVADRHSVLKTSGLISVARSIKERHPDWTDEQVEEEVEAIRADEAATLPPATNFTG